MSERKGQGRIFWGLLLIVMGVVFLLDRMGRLDFGDLVSDYWPVVFILIGISILLSNNFRNIGSGIFFILFGVFFLLIEWGIFRSAARFAWPVAIIVAGLWILLRPAVGRAKKDLPGFAGDTLDIHQVFSGSSRKVESQNFRGGKAEVVFGSAEIDLRAAKLAGGEAALALSAVFGGIEVFVPRDWQVVLEGSPVLGSIESRKPAAPEGGTGGKLFIKGSAVFGSIEVKD